MRTVFCCLLILGLSAAPARAGADFTRSADFASQQAGTLDRLFADLKRSRSDADAERISGEIWRAWRDSGSANINLMLEWAQGAMDKREFAAAMDMLDQIILLAPDFAEGWNRRATLHFMLQEPVKSMADIQRVLELEPRHFGALAGMASILRARGENELALKAYERLLDVHPLMREAQTAAGELADELAGEKL
jgi:tetratricopeptide (TPR) repeat protein